eukprot:TRINITY_DN36177_c0_g1_i1.p1 TRINITY_DN36177_c0_g1~~TRINITY_DN36177_c0_g1_i1.p1  ORF type:complete len:295 (+),score=42.95 TRINITY_DN36177_c0_g1_i1:76-960(+)
MSASSTSFADGSNEFEVDIVKPDSGTLIGLSLIPFGKSLLILGLTAGLIAEWNAKSSRGKAVQLGDTIVAVNDCRGDPKRMLMVFQRDTILKLIVRLLRASVEGDFQVRLARSVPFEPVGIDCAIHDGSLEVRQVVSGMLPKWNGCAKYDAQVRPGDRVVDVNGVSGCATKMMRALKVHLAVVITLKRPKTSSAASVPAPALHDTDQWEDPMEASRRRQSAIDLPAVKIVIDRANHGSSMGNTSSELQESQRGLASLFCGPWKGDAESDRDFVRRTPFGYLFSICCTLSNRGIP